LSIVHRFWWSLQQRVCTGFTPDSLFTILPWNGKNDTKTFAKIYKEYLNEKCFPGIYYEAVAGNGHGIIIYKKQAMSDFRTPPVFYLNNIVTTN